MKRKVFFLIAIASLFIYSCQDDITEPTDDLGLEVITTIGERRTCSSTEHTAKLCMDPSYNKKHLSKLKAARNSKIFKVDCATPKLVPVAVHYQGVTNPDASCLQQLAESQIAVLNADFGATNNDISKWTNQAASSFPGISNGAACLKFVLANTNHPSGYGISNGDLAITINKTTGDVDAKWSGYLNLFIQANTGVLGYAPLGGSGNGDGVVIDAQAFGAGQNCGSIGSQAPYNLGRTTTHEVGHYLLLDHIWGGGCGQDDDVNDTPDSADAYYDCPNTGESSCGSTDMHMNYMDYTNDACMYMFSEGQAARMTNYVNSSLTILTDNASKVIVGAPTSGDDNSGDDNTGDDNAGDDNTDDNNSEGDDDSNDEQNTSSEEVIILITLDEYGSETKWTLKDDFNQVVAKGGPYQDGQSGAVIEEAILLEDGCYKLIIKDAYGDGICCDYGYGQVEVVDLQDNVITYSDGYFGKRERLEFCKDSQGFYGRKGSKDRRAKNLPSKK